MLNRLRRLSPAALVSSAILVVLLCVDGYRLATVNVNSSARTFFASFLIVPLSLFAIALIQCLAPKKDPGASVIVVVAAWFGILTLLFVFAL